MVGYWVGERLSSRVLRLLPAIGPDLVAPRTSAVANVLLVFPALVIAEMLTARGPILAAMMLALLLAALVMIALYTGSETARDSVEGDQARLQSIVAYAPDGIFATGPDLRLEWVNDTVARLTGWSPVDAIGRAVADIMDLSDRQGAPLDQGASFMQAARTGEAVQVPALLRGRDGVEHAVVVSFTAIPGPDGAFGIGVGAVREMDREQDGLQVVEGADLGHELRSPLTAILGYAQLLMNPPMGSIDATRQAEFASRIMSSGDYMLRLVNNLLDLRRMESGADRIEAEPLQLDVILRTTFGMMMPRASEKEMALSLDVAPDLPPLVSDELLVRRVLDNLISNTIKYTPAGGLVRVTAAPEGAGIAIAVTDSGIGLTEDEQAHLFERFFRSGRPEARQERGTGLGLSLVREAARRLGGEVRVTSAVGVGSTFTFWIPTAPPAARADHPASSLSTSG